ncbi:unnamed protein product [Meloidogyne enterolobii]|uniref:Uncharacterized protein n=2 Tax=Meloidogyne enterolobii TaxID=390850 RepID=A0ACB0ZV04_MELEN
MASAQNHQNDEVEGFWLFDGLDEEPYGLLPLVNLSGKSGASSTKNVERIGSYQWRLEEDDPIPGMPLESFYWPGGKLRQDHGVVIYNVNHMKVKDGQLDAAILAAKLCSANNKKKTEINFDDYDIITDFLHSLRLYYISKYLLLIKIFKKIFSQKYYLDAINLQKLFAFGQEAGDGLFRIDCERVGKTVLLSRMEASDLMEIGHLTYDQSMKAKMTKFRSKHCSGPFFQLTSYQFGTLKILVRYEVECADFAGAKAWVSSDDFNIIFDLYFSEIFEDTDQLPEKTEFADNKAIGYINFGNVPDNLPLQLLTTYPHGGGFPFFTWAQMFFTCADQEMIGFWKGNGDFTKPAIYVKI